MKNLLHSLVILSCIILLFIGCSKGSNSYSNTDNTVGLANVTHLWSGYASGYVKGDTMYSGDTTHYVWAKSFSRVITDTSFAVQKINGYEISAISCALNYLSTDAINKIVKFDSLYAGSAVSFLNYYSALDSSYFEFHQITGYNAASGQYYQNNIYLHTVH